VREELLKQAMREMGRRGGKKRLETLTPEERSEIARLAGKKSGQVRAAKKAGAAPAKRKTRAA
jgi:general stress protein YciG